MVNLNQTILLKKKDQMLRLTVGEFKMLIDGSINP